MKEPDQEDDRRDPERHEGGPPDLCDRRTAERVRDEEEGDHHQPKRECVDEQSQRAAQRPARSVGDEQQGCLLRTGRTR